MQGAKLPTTFWHNWPGIAILVVFLLVGALYAVNTPVWQAPDEPAHWNNIGIALLIDLGTTTFFLDHMFIGDQYGFASKQSGRGIWVVWLLSPLIMRFMTMTMIDDDWNPSDPIVVCSPASSGSECITLPPV